MCEAERKESSALSCAGEEEKKAAAKAMNLLLQQDRTERELQDRLYRAGFSEKAARFAMDYVKSFGYIDDLRYATTYLSCQKGSRSRKELRCKLINRGVSPEIVEEAFLREYGEDDEQEALRRILKKRLRGARLSDMDFADRNKVTAYLARKGYALPAIRSAMREQGEFEESEESV